MLIFGLGTGRCGTNSFAHILNHQDGVVCFHEMNPSAMAWHGAERNIHATINQFQLLINSGISTIVTDLSVADRSQPLKLLETSSRPYVVGDIALYYLPYVEYILNNVSDVRFPCLRRDRDETINSFTRKLQTFGYSRSTLLKYQLLNRSTLRNPWSAGDSRRWRCDPVWDRLVRKSMLKSPKLEDYVAEWYDFYYETVSLLQDRFPNNIQIFETSELNEKQSQLKILEFCGVDKARASFVKIHANKSSD